MAKRKPRVEQAPIVRHFGVRLREARVSLGMTQAELATRAGLTSVHLWRLEGGGAAPGIDLVERLARALGVGITALLDEGGATDPLPIFQEKAKEMFDVLLRQGNRDTFLALNPLLACLVENLKRKG